VRIFEEHPSFESRLQVWCIKVRESSLVFSIILTSVRRTKDPCLSKWTCERAGGISAFSLIIRGGFSLKRYEVKPCSTVSFSVVSSSVVSCSVNPWGELIDCELTSFACSFVGGRTDVELEVVLEPLTGPDDSWFGSWATRSACSRGESRSPRQRSPQSMIMQLRADQDQYPNSFRSHRDFPKNNWRELGSLLPSPNKLPKPLAL